MRIRTFKAANARQELKALTRNDGAGDSNGPAVVDELFEGRSLEEELGDDEVGPGINFLLEHQLKG